MNHVATEKDIPELLALFVAWASEIECVPNDESVAQMKSEIEGLMKSGSVFIHRHEDKIDGMIGVNIKKQPWKLLPTLYEQFFFVAKSSRGNGTLGYLLNMAEIYASISGCGEVILNPHEGTDHPEAVARCLKRYGYAVTGYNLGKKINGMLRHNLN